MSEEIRLSVVDEIVSRFGDDQRHIVPILRAVQDKYNYLPEEALRHICETTSITPAAVHGVSTFYSQFRHRPAGEHRIKVCIGTACHVKGAETVFNTFKQFLGIPANDDTDADRLFTVEKVACLGCCMLAPAVQIDDVTYGYVNSQTVPQVIRDFLASSSLADDGKKAASSGRDPVGVVRMCVCSSCAAGGAGDVYEEFKRQVEATGVSAEIKTVGCTGMSFEAPLIEIEMADGSRFRYGKLRPEDVRAVLLRHFKAVGLAKRLRAVASSLLRNVVSDSEWEPVTRYAINTREGPGADWSRGQQRLVTEHAGSLSPLDFEGYRNESGFDALKTCVETMDSAELIDVVTQSGLRGRGGAGYPTGVKWASVRAADGTPKYLVCNGDEGDPGAFMDRMILESFPFRVIEGILIAGYAVGAKEGVIYIRAEYPLAAQRVREALAECERRGVLGEHVMGSDFSFKLSVVEGAGAFVCGEETALMAAIEGRRAMPRFRPPYPSDAGLWGKPTLVNNVETYGLVPWIVRNGSESFAALGTDASKGTKAFALAGKIVHGGLIEVPMGITLRQIVDEIGGGLPEGRTLKAVQVGGPSGGCVPASLADTPVDYDAFKSTGAIMGSGGLVVLDDTDCMVDIARYFLSFTQDESCGKCTFCRVGTRRMLEILECLCHGTAKKDDLDRLEHLAHIVERGSLCGLGKTAPNPVLSTLRHFRDEFEAHLAGKCPAKKCKALIQYRINDDCIGCTRCAQRCPTDAIPMKPYEKHEIDVDECVRCDTCRQVCPSDAVIIVDR